MKKEERSRGLSKTKLVVNRRDLIKLGLLSSAAVALQPGVVAAPLKSGNNVNNQPVGGNMAREFDDFDLNNLANEVAAASGVSPQNALSVLRALGADNLIGNVNVLNQVASVAAVQRSLGVSIDVPLDNLNMGVVKLGICGSHLGFVDAVA